MIWFWLACSSSEMAVMEATEELSDSGFVYDTGQLDAGAEDADLSISPQWSKLSVDLNADGEGWSAKVWEDLYAEDMTWLCQRQSLYDKVEMLTPPIETIALWSRLSQPTLTETSCDSVQVSAPQENIVLGIGELLSDIAVATEVTHWMNGDDELETENVWGAYIQAESDMIWTFGVAYQPSEQEYVLRTVYALPF